MHRPASAPRRRLALALAALGPVTGFAQTTLRWTSGDWNTADTNWRLGNNAPVSWTAPSGDGTSDLTAEFFYAGNTVNITAPVTANRLMFTNDGYVLSASGGGTLSLAHRSDAAAPRVSVLFAEQSATISAPIVGGGWSKDGSGTLVLSGTNTFTGVLTIAEGTVRATTRADALGAGTVTFAPASYLGSNLELANDTGLNFARDVAISQGANIVSDRLTAGNGVTHTLGSLTLNTDANPGSVFLTFSAGTNVTGGTAGITFDSVSLNNGAYITVAANTLLTLGSLSSNGNNFTIQGDGDTTISGSLQSTNDNNGLTKSGSGTLTLLGASNTLESLYLNGGAIVVAGGTVSGKRVDILNGGSSATLSGSDASWTLREDLYINGTGNTAATMTVSGGAELSFRSATVGDFGNSGRLVVTGAGSSLKDAAAFPYTGLTVGGTGPGSLELSAGATAESITAVVGRSSTGSVLLTGSGSSWTVGTSLYLGLNSGSTGSLTVADGATGSSLGDLYVGFYGTGSLLIRDAGSKWTAHGDLSVFNGDVTVTDGGTFQIGATGTGNLYFSIGTTGHIGTGGSAGILTAGGLGVDGELVFNHSNNFTLAPTLFTGSGTIAKQGSGTLTLQGDNSRFAGAVTVSGGTLRASGNRYALGTGTLALSGGNLELANNSALNFALPTGLTADSTVTSNRNTTSTTGVTHTLGTLSIGANTLSIARGDLITGTGTAGVTFGATSFTADGATFDPGANTVLTLGALGGNYAFEKKGAGQLTLGTASTRNSTAGSTTLTAGILRLTNASALNTSASAALSLNGGTLQPANNNATTFNGTALTLGGNATIAPSRTSNGASVTHTLGALTLGGYALTVDHGTNFNTNNTGSLIFGATTLTGDATLNLANVSGTAVGVTTLGALGDGGAAHTLTKQGAGTLTLATAATGLVSGSGLRIEAGTVNLNHAAALGSLATVTLSPGATLALGPSVAPTFGALNGTGGTVTLGTNTLTVGNAASNLDSAFGGVLGGTSGKLTKAGSGTLTLSGINTYTGATTVSAGRLHLTGSASSSAFTVQSGATLSGTGTAGATTILSGGTLSPGSSPGLFTVNGGLTLNSGSFTLFEIAGLTRGTGYDAINVSGALNTGGTLSVSFTSGFTPSAPATFDFFNFTSFGGSFAQVNLPVVAGYTWNTSQLSIDGTVSLVASAIPEPSTWAALAGLGAFVSAFRRRRRR